MAFYQTYLVCYDIEDNKVRKKFFDELKDLGLVPIQKSVFWGQLCQAEFNSLKRLAHDKLDGRTDKFFWLQTHLSIEHLQQGIGYKNFEVINADGSHTL